MTIYRIDLNNQDGTAVVSCLYFTDKEDAESYYSTHRVFPHAPACSRPIPIRVWDKGEYSDDALARERALSKLTEREIILLGIRA
jgi:hypothetical protein